MAGDLVVGAGPVGLFTALLLADQGVPVRIVDEEFRTAAHSYALALHPRSLQLLDRAGVTADLLRQGYRVETVAFYEGSQRRGEMKLADVGGDFPYVLVMPQSVLEGVLERRLKEHGVKPIDMVVVNLYQFEKTVSREGVTLDEAIENIDIGGPSMLRSSAKNFKFVTVIVDPADYDIVLKEMEETGGETTLQTRFRLARKVFELTHKYDGAISRYLEENEL